MNLLYITWDNYQQEEIKNAFSMLGHSVFPFTKKPRNYRIDPRLKREIISYIHQQNIQFVFSTKYFPLVADICHSLEIIYIIWCHNTPAPYLYSNTVLYPENHIFIFDSFLFEDLKQLGVCNVYYLPLAVSLKQDNYMPDAVQETTDISFVGSLCTTPDVLQNNLSKLSEETIGFLSGLIQSQKIIWGQYFLRQCIAPILEELQNNIPLSLQTNGLDTYQQAFADYYLTKLVTQKERLELLTQIYTSFQNEKITYYITKKIDLIPELIPFFTCIKEFDQQKFEPNPNITINITKRSNFAGIPQLFYDIFNSKHFVLSNYQNDFPLVFQNMEIPYFSDTEDLNNKIEYYLSHSKERREFTLSIHNELQTHHTVFHRIQTILRTVFP